MLILTLRAFDRTNEMAMIGTSYSDKRKHFYIQTIKIIQSEKYVSIKVSIVTQRTEIRKYILRFV